MRIKDFMAKKGRLLSIQKKQHVFYQGDGDNSLYYVVDGLLKAYYVSAQGKENIKSFIQPKNIIGSLSAAYSGQPCTFNLLALEDCQLVKIKFDELLQASKLSITMASELIEILMALSMNKEQREYQFLMLDAEQRYVKFRDAEPELMQRLTQNDIARFLGITPVALSRIKNKSNK